MHMLLEDTNYADGCFISSLSHVPERIAVSFTQGYLRVVRLNRRVGAMFIMFVLSPATFK
jgi:hypothetical protein